MQPQWLITVRSLLRDLKRADSAKPQKAQLEHLRATIHSAEEISGLQNVGITAKFLRDERR